LELPLEVERDEDEAGKLPFVRSGAKELEGGALRDGGGAGAGREGVREARLL